MSDSAIGRTFDRSAAEYDDVLARNRAGAERLIDALPAGEYREVLDVGCGTGFASLAAVERRGALAVTGVDVSAGMLERYREKLAERPGVRVTTHRADAARMPVPATAFDAVVSSMALHWVPDRQAAVGAMARALRPGGALGILAGGRGTDREFRQVLEEMRPPPPAAWLDAFDRFQIDEVELEDHLERAGLEPVDVWLERRRRRVDPERYLARMAAVASHVSEDLPEEEREELGRRVREALGAASGARGFEYAFAKVFGIGRKRS
jgi:SAM-dependent methyltransferase